MGFAGECVGTYGCSGRGRTEEEVVLLAGQKGDPCAQLSDQRSGTGNGGP